MSSGGSRVSIPADLLKTIREIREITGKQHSDEDILSVFKECKNDPHETAEKLLYLDTFQVVKSKRERKKENSVPNTQGSGRDGRRNFASNYAAHYANNGRSAAFKRRSGANQIGGSRTALPATNKAINGTIPRSIKSTSNGVTNHKIQDGFISPVNNGVKKQQPLSKSTSSSEDVVELASTVPVAVSASDSVDGTCQISQQASTFTKPDSMLIATSNCSSQSSQVTRSEAAATKSKSPAVIKSDVSERPHVTFPVHLAKVLENGLTFGSFDTNVVKEAYSDNSSVGCGDSNVELSQGSATNEASARDDISSFSQDKDESSNSAPETEIALQSDQTVNPAEGSEGDKPKEFLPINQAANSDTPSAISYPDQSSIAAAQQAMHLFRQQYPPNFFPYGPYFPPFYMPQPYINPFLNPIGQQQVAGDDAPTPPESTLPLSQINTVNSPTTIIPSPYGSFNHIQSAATVESNDEEEKTENIYTNGALSAWMAAQSLANLQLSHMYNLALQGQTLPFPTAQPGFNGLYQQTHPILPAPTMAQTLPPIPGLTEPVGLPHTSNQQPQAALTNLSNN